MHISFFCENKFLYLLGKYPGVRLLDHIVTLCLILRNCQAVFQIGCTILHSHLKVTILSSGLKNWFSHFVLVNINRSFNYVSPSFPCALSSEMFTWPETGLVVSCKYTLRNPEISEHRRVAIIWHMSLEATHYLQWAHSQGSVHYGVGRGSRESWTELAVDSLPSCGAFCQVA